MRVDTASLNSLQITDLNRFTLPALQKHFQTLVFNLFISGKKNQGIEMFSIEVKTFSYKNCFLRNSFVFHLN